MQTETIDIVKKAPALKCDEGNILHLNGKIERRIVWNLIGKLWDAEFAVIAVEDGDERIKCRDAEHPAMAAMEAVFAVDEATLIVRHKRVGSKDRWIKLVGGNGEDIISDWGVLAWGDPDGFAAFMESFDATENY